MAPEKTLLRLVGKAIHEFRMIRDGDRIAVGVSGGKDSLTLLDALLSLQKKVSGEIHLARLYCRTG